MTRTVAAYVPDLMDKSRMTGAPVAFARRPDDLLEMRADLMVVDLGRPGVLEVIPYLSAPVVAFAHHEDESTMVAARAAGCVEVLTRSVFFRRYPDVGREQPEDS